MGSLEWRKIAESWISAYLSLDPTGRFVFGTGEHARLFAKKVGVAAFVDDYRAGQTLHGIPIISSDDLPPNAVVLIASLLRTQSIAKCLADRKMSSLDLFAWEANNPEWTPTIPAWAEFRHKYAKHQARLDKVRTRITEAESIKTWDGLITFRLTGDIRAIDHCVFDPIGQYIETDILPDSHGATFVDVGAYDSATSQAFSRSFPGIRTIHMFEPSMANQALVKACDQGWGDCEVSLHQVALGACKHESSFVGDAGSTSRMSVDGNETVRVRTLDSFAFSAPLMIKMDIEGAERLALVGSQATIRTHKPSLAIAAYHLWDDFWVLPDIVLAARDDYTIHVRHYTEGRDETVLFFT